MIKPKNEQFTQPTLPFEIEGIPGDAESQARRGWKLEVNDEEVDTVTSARLKHDRIGIEVEYGQRPEGYDGFIIREPGGAATMPYMIDPDGRIYIGVVEESRPTMGEEKTRNIPRGFSDFGKKGKEDKKETAIRELKEETGFRAIGSRIITLAEGLNPNSTYFDYSGGEKEGVSIFAIPVTADELEMHVGEDGDPYYTFPPQVNEQAEGDKTGERIFGSRFIPIGDALRSRDMFTSAAAGQLAGRLLAEGEYLLPQKPLQMSDSKTISK